MRTQTVTLGGNVKCDHIKEGPVKKVVIDLDDSVPPHVIRLALCPDCWEGFVSAVEAANATTDLKVRIK